jgi:transcriptional regulator with XRE-family HTH domain
MAIPLRDIRLKKGLTQVELGKLIGLTKKAVWAIEHGRSQGSVGAWDRLEKALGVPQQVLRGKENS